MTAHHRFIKYIYSTLPKYVIHRSIIIYYYKSLNCSITVLNKTATISRTSLKRIINDSIEEGWLEKRLDLNNKRQILIYATKLRLKFWLLYCRQRLNPEIVNKVNTARNKLIEFDNLESKKQKFNINTIEERMD